MFEVFFILVVIYIAYVVYGSIDNEEQANKSAKIDMANTVKPPVTPPINKAPKKSPAKPQEPAAKDTPAIVKAEPKKAAKPKMHKTAAPKIELRTVEMKNPKTGEQAKVANNYRMAKRWIKEALVEEGLLEKIYKNNEMDDAAKVKVAKALSIIKAMDKYKV